MYEYTLFYIFYEVKIIQYIWIVGYSKLKKYMYMINHEICDFLKTIKMYRIQIWKIKKLWQSFNLPRIIK